MTTLQTNPGPQRRSSLARGSGAAIVALGGLLGVCGCGATAEPTSTENSAGTVSVAGTDGAAAGAAGTATAGAAPLGDAAGAGNTAAGAGAAGMAASAGAAPGAAGAGDAMAGAGPMDMAGAAPMDTAGADNGGAGADEMAGAETAGADDMMPMAGADNGGAGADEMAGAGSMDETAGASDIDDMPMAGGDAMGDFVFTSGAWDGTENAACTPEMKAECFPFPDDNILVEGNANISPELNWSGAPAGTLSFAVTLKDLTNMPTSDVQGFVHWAIWNIPGDATGLPEGLGSGSPLMNPMGAEQASFQADDGYAGSGRCGNVYEFKVYALGVATLDINGDQKAAYQAIEGSPDVLAQSFMRVESCQE